MDEFNVAGRPFDFLNEVKEMVGEVLTAVRA